MRDLALIGVGMWFGIGLGIAGASKWMWWRIEEIRRKCLLHSRTCGQLGRDCRHDRGRGA